MYALLSGFTKLLDVVKGIPHLSPSSGRVAVSKFITIKIWVPSGLLYAGIIFWL
jgi:hypothetical protein